MPLPLSGEVTGQYANQTQPSAEYSSNIPAEYYYYNKPICISICTVNGLYFILKYIPQEVTNENAITLDLAHQKTVIPCVILRVG